LDPLYFSQFAVACSAGVGTQALLQALRTRTSGLAPCSFETAHLDTWVGQVPDARLEPLAGDLARFDCRNNRLARLGIAQDGFEDAVRQARSRYGSRRIGVFLGTSTSGILQTEQAYRRRSGDGALPSDLAYATTHNTFSSAWFLQVLLGLDGPAAVVSTACSSSAKAFANAARMMAAGACDAAIVGGVDSLCLTTLYGFGSLGLLAHGPCRPFDADRDGISIGEGAAFVLLEKSPGAQADGAISLLGIGESSDAYHMSSPHPEGLGAQLAMRSALAAAGLDAGRVDYVNLHGTGTQSNDETEGRAIMAVFGDRVACSSTKGWTGHTLGACGAIEAVVSALAIREGFMPGSANTLRKDPALPLRYLVDGAPQAPSLVMSNAFGFGGTNCSLLLGRARQ
jgi:3-oxoacyl-[acyl-carrier-protein] synthase-1